MLRYCKVARYDADLYYDMRMVKNMGGIGAHHDADYDTLKRFVEDPWMCKETMHVRCQERDFQDFQCLGLKVQVTLWNVNMELGKVCPQVFGCICWVYELYSLQELQTVGRQTTGSTAPGSIHR